MPSEHHFGGDWTKTKLEVLRKYLCAYTTILSSKPYFRFAYIDAFAGTGYIHNKKESTPRLIEYDEEAVEYIKGSAKVALECKPGFHKYIFIEKDEDKVNALLDVIKNEHAEMGDEGKVSVMKGDANVEIRKICKAVDWRKRRAVIFLDPYGMEVEWQTIETIAQTKAIDLWILFPLGVSVNRLLKNDGNISESWSVMLDKIFGTHEWYERFYRKRGQQTLFGTEEKIEKTANFDKIAQFYIERLKTIFPGVVEKPIYLYNSMNNPIFLFCFAAANEKGSKLAIKIANDIMRREMQKGQR